ncbi:MAG: amino acid ABC transporter substrate-binding protein [Gammaproteobacteria bacterium]|nr:amino acid ABC transporter substrate-binding protein [Gammaproteobacteria bacterium]
MTNDKGQIRFLLSALIILLTAAGILPAYAEILAGASVALSGKYASTGREQLNGYKLWVEDVNARGGLLGQKVRMVHYDDKSKPGMSARLYKKLINSDKADLLLSPYSSGVTLAASKVTEKHGFPMVSAGASSSKIWGRGYKNIFGLYTPAEVYMDRILEFAKAKGLKRLALIYADTAFPRAIAKGVKQKAKKLGMALVFEEEYSKNSTDFASMLVEIKMKRADIVVGGSYLPDSAAFMRQAKKHRVHTKIFAFAVGPGLPDFGKQLGADAEGVMGNTQWEASLAIPGAAEFAGRYEEKFGHKPGYHAAGGYGAGQVLEAAVNKARSLDRDKLRNVLSNLDTVTVFGRYKVDKTGKQTGKPGYAIQWQNGERYIVLPKEVAKRSPAYPFKPWNERYTRRKSKQ